MVHTHNFFTMSPYKIYVTPKQKHAKLFSTVKLRPQNKSSYSFHCPCRYVNPRLIQPHTIFVDILRSLLCHCHKYIAMPNHKPKCHTTIKSMLSRHDHQLPLRSPFSQMHPKCHILTHRTSSKVMGHLFCHNFLLQVHIHPNY